MRKRLHCLKEEKIPYLCTRQPKFQSLKMSNPSLSSIFSAIEASPRQNESALPEGELGGTPYHFESFSWSETYINPGYGVSNDGRPTPIEPTGETTEQP